jgi:ATP-dependent Clp protease, protease subunit
MILPGVAHLPGFPGRPLPGGPGPGPGWLPGAPAPAARPVAEPLGVTVDPLRADLDEQLWRRRIVRVTGRLDRPAAETALARVLLADADGPDPIQLHLSCPDGDLAAAVVLAETLQLVRARVTALAVGTVGGPAVGAYAAARHRRAHPHARFVLSEPRAAFSGGATQLEADLAVQTGQLRFLLETIAAATGRSVDDVEADLRAHRVLPADEAVAYGLVHEVARPV